MPQPRPIVTFGLRPGRKIGKRYEVLDVIGRGTEGEVYRISQVRLSGEMVVPESELRRLILFQAGDLDSLRRVTQSTEAMTLRLGLDGYAFAKVDAVPQIDPDTKQLSLALVVDPGHRVYVRRINFNGATSVNDVVFRREMRQLEGSSLSHAGVGRS